MIIEGGLEPGIYFGLPAERYHADTALSRSDLLALNDTPFTYWDQSWMNPNKKPRLEKDELKYGEAFHCQLFEPERFEKQYFVFPSEQWDSARQMIAKEEHDAIVHSINVLRAGKDSKNFLSGGMPEVTIVFDAFGMRFRVRIDYLTFWPGNPVVTVVDFKTIHSLMVWHLKQAFERYGYDIQLYLYKLAVVKFKEQFARGEAHIFGKVDEEWFKKFLLFDMTEFLFIFQRKTPPFPYEPLFPEDDTEQRGMDRTMDGIDIFKKNFKKYGVNPWEVSDGKVKRFSMSYGIIKEN